MKSDEEPTDDVAAHEGIQNDIGNHSDRVGRIEIQNLRICCNHLSDKQFVPVVGKPDPLKLPFSSLSVLGDTVRNALRVEVPPINDRQNIGFVIKITDLASVHEHYLGQIYLRRSKRGPSLDLSRRLPFT